MSETVNAMQPNFGPFEAAEAIHSARQWDVSLRHRTEGLSWMLWGVALGGMFLSYAWAVQADAPGWVFGVAWAPWVLIGNVFTLILWRSAHLTRRDAADAAWRERKRWASRALPLAYVLHALAFFVAFAVFQVFTWVTPMIVVGLFWASLPLFNRAMTKRSKTLIVGIGATQSLLALALAALHLVEPLGSILASVGVLVIPFLGGCYHALKG